MWQKLGGNGCEDMTDVVVRIDLDDSAAETKLIEAVDQFTLSRCSSAFPGQQDDAPDIMIKTIPDGEVVCKSVIFQDQKSADEFLYFWRRARRVA